MKIKFQFHTYHWPSDSVIDATNLVTPVGRLIDAPPEISSQYKTHLLSSLSSDFVGSKYEFCDYVIQQIERLEKGEAAKYVWEGQSFVHTITRDGVTFEHSIFGECPEWPIWTCPLSHYKAALQGWRKFLEMPNALGSELIVELPEVIYGSNLIAEKNSHVAELQRQKISENCQRKS